MSMIARIRTEMRDLFAIKSASEELGLEFREGNGGNAPVIRIPGSGDEIRLSKAASGSYELGFSRTRANVVQSALGPGAKRLKQLYGVHKTMIEAHKGGFRVERENQADGSIKIRVLEAA